MTEAGTTPLGRLIREFGAYGLASVAGLGSDMALLAALVSVAKVHYLVAATISFICAGILVHAISVRYVFRFRRVDRRTLELSFFLALGVVGLFVNAAVIYFVVNVVHLHYMLGKLLAAGFTFCANFFLRRHFLFSPAPSLPARVS
jgi:putative flippase GtrA